MLITRTPLRISLGGGGTDLPSYYAREGGFVLSAAIDKYIYIGINPTFSDEYLIKYSELERVRDVAQIRHPVVREALRLHPVGPMEIVSMADVPAGTGLGSSGAFTVGLLRALHAVERGHVTPSDLAEEAAHIEIDLLREPAGKQDHYISSFGGITCFEFDQQGVVRVSPMNLSTSTLSDLEEHLLMFFTGFERRAADLLGEQRWRTEASEPAMIDGLKRVHALGLRIRTALEEGDTQTFASLMSDHWIAKRERSKRMSNDDIDKWYEAGMSNGALGGKLVGAGGGGFLLFYADDPRALRREMSRIGLSEVNFNFDHDGSNVLLRG
jgi:D-glycero-alpha-D-manno-heptose-7-phosphate kinase